MPYLLDAKLDFCTAFWDWLIAENADENVFSIERVADEILAGGDELADWADERGADFFLKPDASLLPALGTVSAWAAGQNYEPAAVNTSSSRRLLFGGSRARSWSHSCNARDCFNIDEED
jgi:hypothetical protein